MEFACFFFCFFFFGIVELTRLYRKVLDAQRKKISFDNMRAIKTQISQNVRTNLIRAFIAPTEYININSNIASLASHNSVEVKDKNKAHGTFYKRHLLDIGCSSLHI